MARKSVRTLWKEKLESPDAKTGGFDMVKVGIRQPFHGVVLGVDPSLRGTGIAVVKFKGNSWKKLYDSRTLKLGKELSQAECFVEITKKIRELVDYYDVRHLALEEAIYVQNYKTALALGGVRGVVIAAATLAEVPVFEYAPLRMKQAVVGYGRASKEQVAKTVAQYFGLKSTLPFDESDAIGMALCHAMTYRGDDH